MARVKKSESSEPTQKIRPALTPEARENQMISLAERLAEKQLLEGTASSQVIVHYLKLATVREKLEKEKLAEENKLLRAKTEALEAAKEGNALYAEALRAMRTYSGQGSSNDEYDEDY